MPAFPRPVVNLDAMVSDLQRIRAGRGSPYPFYGALLFTRAPGADANLRGFVASQKDELNALTGRRCKLFYLRDDWGGVHAEQVYRVADALGVSAGALPCLAFF